MSWLNRIRGTEKTKQNVRSSYRNISIILIVICLLTCVFCFQYYRSLHATIRDESKAYLQEVSRRIGENIDRIIKDNFAMLYTMGSSLEQNGDHTLTDIQNLLLKQRRYWEYENILLVDKNGKAYDIDNSSTTFLSIDDSMRAGMLNKEQGMATAQMVNNKEYIIFTVPLNNVKVDGEEMIALAASYDPVNLDQVLSMTSFDDQAYSQIITKNGTVVTRSGIPDAIKSGYNIFTTLENANLDADSSINQVQEDIKKDIGSQISFSLDGIHRYMVYTPIQPDDWYLLTFVPFQTVNAKSDMLLRTTLLICGLLTITFSGLIAALIFSYRANRRKLERIAYVDEVTGGNTIQRFYKLAESILASSAGEQYALIYSNIENFKVLNEQLGRQNCDMILYHFNHYTASILEDQECMGRLSADNFCLLMHFSDESTVLQRLAAWRTGAEAYIQEILVPWDLPTTEFGIYVLENTSLPLPQMIDRAKLALKDTSHMLARKLHYAFYDDNARRVLFREKQLEDMMEPALAGGEFKMYLQPKYKLPEEKVGGAEALVRWKSSFEGMIFPNEFIPLFEKNGFIVKLDLWMFEEVCRTISSWIDRGYTPHKVSVNCSRVHFKNPQFLSLYEQIASKYNFDRSLVEIELTESVVFEDTERLGKIINDIRSAGFGCSMDDFGSGYSSLNLIQSIPVDTLKIDRIFFQRFIDEPKRTEAVVGSITKMAESLSMTTVAEGVEYRDQVEMLKRVGCNYIQGYVFAKPMEVSAFEELAFR